MPTPFFVTTTFNFDGYVIKSYKGVVRGIVLRHWTARLMNDWREETLGRMRRLIAEADPGAVEVRKWSKPSNPAGLFNSSLEGNARRAIDIHEGEKIDAEAFKALVRAAVALNAAGAKRRA